jgi:hypothetical protein
MANTQFLDIERSTRCLCIDDLSEGGIDIDVASLGPVSHRGHFADPSRFDWTALRDVEKESACETASQFSEGRICRTSEIRQEREHRVRIFLHAFIDGCLIELTDLGRNLFELRMLRQLPPRQRSLRRLTHSLIGRTTFVG